MVTWQFSFYKYAQQLQHPCFCFVLPSSQLSIWLNAWITAIPLTNPRNLPKSQGQKSTRRSKRLKGTEACGKRMIVHPSSHQQLQSQVLPQSAEIRKLFIFIITRQHLGKRCVFKSYRKWLCIHTMLNHLLGSSCVFQCNMCIGIWTFWHCYHEPYCICQNWSACCDQFWVGLERLYFNLGSSPKLLWIYECIWKCFEIPKFQWSYGTMRAFDCIRMDDLSSHGIFWIFKRNGFAKSAC